LDEYREIAHAVDMSETDDYISITRLQAAYADVVTRRAWPELRPLFEAEAPITVAVAGGDTHEFSGPIEIGDFIGASLEQFEFFQFVILNTVINIGVGGDADRADGRMYMSELRQFAASGSWSVVYGVYHDCYRRSDKQWRFMNRQYQTLGRTAPQMHVFDFPHQHVLGQL
jgi:hypothetical protein